VSDRGWKIIRDMMLVGLGVFMLAHETITQASPDPIIIGAALALLGLPSTLRLDARRREKDNGE
jgi:hypothetical protein